jgi:spore germination protein KC
MRNICIVGIILLMVILFMSGCWDFSRLRDHTVILGIAVDNQNKGNKMAVEIAQFGAGLEQNRMGKSKELTSTSSNKSIELQLHDYQLRTSGFPYYTNLNLLVIGEEQAKIGIANIISHFIRDPNMRRSIQAVIAEDSAVGLLGVKSHQENFTSFYLSKLVEKTEKAGKTIASDIGDISRAIHGKSVALIPLIKSSKDKGEAKVVGTAIVVKNGKMVSQLTIEESKTVSYLKKNSVVTAGSFRMTCPKTNKGSVSLDIAKTKASLDPKVKEGQLLITGKLKVISDLAEYTCADEKVQRETSLTELGEQFSQKLKEKVNSDLTTIFQRTNADVLDLQNQLKKKPEEWKRIEKRFPELLKNADVDIHVSVKIRNRGSEA